jgi:hypothetical protein
VNRLFARVDLASQNQNKPLIQVYIPKLQLIYQLGVGSRWNQLQLTKRLFDVNHRTIGFADAALIVIDKLNTRLLSLSFWISLWHNIPRQSSDHLSASLNSLTKTPDTHPKGSQNEKQEKYNLKLKDQIDRHTLNLAVQKNPDFS